MDRFYVNAKGDVQPCEFLNVSFGNILEEEFTAIYSRMRKEFAKPGENWLCETCAPLIREGIRQQGTLKLPLTPEATRQICATMDHGKPTAFYERVKELK